MNKAKQRNSRLVDRWSLVHVVSGTGLYLLLGEAWLVFVLTTLWEPFEIFVLSPLLARRGITFGYESLRNSLSDICFNTLGIILGMFIVLAVS